MNNNDFVSINDVAFEDLLKSSVPYEPPEEIVKVVTPWKKAIRRVLAGLALNTLTLNLFYLNFILPLIGTALSILGLRVLRNETKWFKAYYIFTIIREGYFLFTLALNATISLREMIPQAVLVTVNLIMTLLNILFFCASLYSAEKKAGTQLKKLPMVAFVLWYLVLAFLGVINYNGFIIPWVMIIGFIIILVSLNKISKEIDSIGYNIENAPVKVNDKALVSVLVATLVIGLGVGYAFGGSYLMKWEEKDINEHSQVQEVKDELIGLGFPEKVLDDMTAEDILSCQGATKVVVYENTVPFNDDTRVVTVTEQKTPYFSSTYDKTIHDVEEMTITGVGVYFGDGENGFDGTWNIIHHFCWDINPGFYGTESIQLWPSYGERYKTWYSDGKVSGRVLYTKDGIDYVAPYYSLGDETYTSDTIIWGQQTNTDIFAAFSLPNDGEKQRGYIAYTIEDNSSEDNHVIDSWFNYTHQESFLQYPAITAKKARQSGFFNDFPFRTQQETLQIWDDHELIK